MIPKFTKGYIYFNKNSKDNYNYNQMGILTTSVQ